MIGRFVTISLARDELLAEDLSGPKPPRPPFHPAPLDDASPELLLHVNRGGGLLDCPTATRVGDLLEPDIATRVMDGVHRALDTRAVVFDVWEATDGPDGDRAYCQGRFTCDGLDEVLVLLRDATMDICRRDAEQLVSDLSWLAVAATNRRGQRRPSSRCCASTAAFVGGRSGIVLVPDDSPMDFTIEHVWEPNGMPTNAPALPPGEPSWLVTFVEDLDEPVILNIDTLPAEAVRLRSIAQTTIARRPRAHPARLRRRARRRDRGRLSRAPRSRRPTSLPVTRRARHRCSSA